MLLGITPWTDGVRPCLSWKRQQSNITKSYYVPRNANACRNAALAQSTTFLYMLWRRRKTGLLGKGPWYANGADVTVLISDREGLGDHDLRVRACLLWTETRWWLCAFDHFQWRVQMGARGARAIPSRLKKRGGGERRRPTPAHVRTHTWCKVQMLESARSKHTVRGHAYVRVYVRTCGRRCSAHL